jgi:hypothetical protein
MPAHFLSKVEGIGHQACSEGNTLFNWHKYLTTRSTDAAKVARHTKRQTAPSQCAACKFAGLLFYWFVRREAARQIFCVLAVQ